MLAQKCSFQSIAKTLGRNVSTISREVGSGSCSQYTYRAEKAQNRAVRNSRKRRGGKYVLNDSVKLKRYVYRQLRLKWSPVQIAEMLEKDYPTDTTMRISPEAIYTCYRYLSGAFSPKISGHRACFLILISREHLPLRCLNFGLQSVNGFVRRRMSIPFNHSLACAVVLNPLSDLSRALKCELKSSMRFVLLGQLAIVLYANNAFRRR